MRVLAIEMGTMWRAVDGQGAYRAVRIAAESMDGLAQLFDVRSERTERLVLVLTKH